MEEEKRYISLIREIDDRKSWLEIITIDEEDSEVVDDGTYKMSPKDVTAFFQHVPCFLVYNVKAVILQTLDFQHPDFKNSIHFRQCLIAELDKHKILYRVLDIGTFFITSLFIGAKIDCKPGDTVLTARVAKEYVSVTEFYRQKNGYIITSRGKEKIDCPKGYNPAELKIKIFGSCDPKKIIMAPLNPFCPTLMKDMRKLLKSKKLIVFENFNIRQMFFTETLIELAKMIVDKEYTRYYMFPKLYIEFFVDNVKKYANEYNMNLICDLRTSMPWQKTWTCARTHEPFYLACTFGGQDTVIVEKYPIPEKPYHSIKFDLEVDQNILPKLTHIPFIYPFIEELPQRIMKKNSISETPIIIFFVILLWNKKEKCYEFAKNWNGIHGEDLFISFDEEKPKYRNAAFQVLKEKPSFVVYDVIRIMAMFIGLDTKNPNWKFTITKDDDHPILVEFDSFEGTKKAAPPEFLMALLLKAHLKAIKKETGEKSKKLVIHLMHKTVNDNFEKEKKWNLVQDQIAEACELLKIDCDFTIPL